MEGWKPLPPNTQRLTCLQWCRAAAMAPRAAFMRCGSDGDFMVTRTTGHPAPSASAVAVESALRGQRK